MLVISEPLDSVESLLHGGERALEVEGDLQASRRWFDAAYRAAETERDGPGMARAALGLCGLWVHEHRSVAGSALVQARLRSALDAVEPSSTLGLRLRARLAGEADYLTGDSAGILAVVDEARRVGDSVALSEATSLAHHCLLGPGHGRVRRRLAQDLIGEGLRSSRRNDLMMGMLWHTVDLFLDGDPHAERGLAELRDLVAEQEHRAVEFVICAVEGMLSIRAGRFEQALAQANACLQQGRYAGDVDAAGWYNGQLVAIEWFRGGIAEMVPSLQKTVNSPNLSSVDNAPLAALAVATATAGDDRQAAGALARLRGRDLGQLPRCSSWLVAMYGIVEAACLLSDAETAMEAYKLLEPFGRLPMVASLGVACFGAVEHALGVAMLTVGDTERATEHLQAAVQENLALEHWPAVVLSRARLAEALAGSEDAGTQRDLALREAAELGMTLPEIPAPRVRTSQRQLVTCRRYGRKWMFELGRRSALVEHSVGMTYLATLLANPGYELLAIELAAGPGLNTSSIAAGAASSGQPLLDEAATQYYRRRLAELDEELEEYEANHDLARAERLRAERDWLISELTTTVGLSGRVRQFADNEERARISVGKAIRRALDRITAADQTIGEVLRASLSTGIRCRYQPL
jgi:hypothetical protein